MTCKNAKKCINYRLNDYECDHEGENCHSFAEKMNMVLVYGT